MLLGNLIHKLQSDYADIQSQIDELQEQQREIQAKLQEIGSVESQMLSAVHLVQEAIQSCIEVCPEQLSHFQQTIINLFPDSDSKPIAVLTPSQTDPDPEPDPEPEPEPKPSEPQPEADSTSSNVLIFPGSKSEADPDPDPELKPEAKPGELFKFSISHGGGYTTYWREEDDGTVTVIFRQLKIRPRDKQKTEGYNPFAPNNKGTCWRAYLTDKAFTKIEDQAQWIEATVRFEDQD